MMTESQEFTGIIGWQERKLDFGTTEDSGIYEITQAIVTRTDSTVTRIVIDFLYDGNRNVLTLAPSGADSTSFQGRLFVQGGETPKGLQIHCTLFTNPDDEWMLFGRWYEGKEYVWWTNCEPN